MAEQTNNYENVQIENNMGFDMRFVTMRNNSPRHWHRELEILYILNGHATVNMEGRSYAVNPLDAIVIDHSKFHEVLYALPQTMGICIHIPRNMLSRFLPSQEILTFQCAKEWLTEENEAFYEQICEFLKELTRLYVENHKSTYRMRSTALILEILAVLVESFSKSVTPTASFTRLSNIERLEQVCNYVEHHYKEEIVLQDAADELGLNREYFCRFFKENMGIPFIKYVNQVRINHIYQELLHSEDSIQEIIERHGFFNQKLFYRMFKEQYDCTPREVRSMAKNNPEVPN